MNSGSDPSETAAPSLLEQHLAINSDPCPMCGYNLHRLRGSACPECGQTLELRVAVTSPRLAAFYTGLIGLAAGLGFAALVLLYGVQSALRHGFAYWLPGMIVLLIEVLMFGALTIVWLRWARRIRQAPSVLRWGMAAGTWALALAALVAFGIVIE